MTYFEEPPLRDLPYLGSRGGIRRVASGGWNEGEDEREEIDMKSRIVYNLN